MLELEQLSKAGLINLIKEYDGYVKEVCDDEQNSLSRYPVAVNEYLNNEFIQGKKEEDYKLKVISFAEEYSDIFTETSARIVDVFECVLGDHDMKIPDSNRMGEPDEAMIFGETYYNMESEVEDILNRCVNQIYQLTSAQV